MTGSMWSKPQWTLDVTIHHGPAFGHRIEARTLGHIGGWQDAGTWRWSSLGVPEQVLTDLTTRVMAVLTEHLVSRYGVQGELPVQWAGDPGPF